MPDKQQLAALACPRCAAPLGTGDPLVCGGCGMSYPVFADIPCLVPEPALWRARTVQRLDEYLALTARRLADLERDLQAAGLLPRTRARLARIVDGMKVDRELLQRVLAPLRAGALALPSPAAFTNAPGDGIAALLTCYENVFRDWVWGDAESREALRIVEQLAREARVAAGSGRWAMLGAGAGRLAVDVHRVLQPAQTLALDINPLPLMIADRLVRGETLDAAEFPVAPLGEAEVVVPRRLSCPLAVPPGLTFLFADGLAPPFPPGSLDVVLTPWFIDAVEADPRATAAAVNRVLASGGTWINFGPLRFKGATASLYTIEEILDIVADSGFDPGVRLREHVPYFAAPGSGFHRRELVYGFAARKTGEAQTAPAPAPEPGWATDPALPVPVLPEWASLQKVGALANGVLSMIDGRRTIADMADVLGRSWDVDPRALDAQLQSFLLRLLPR